MKNLQGKLETIYNNPVIQEYISEGIVAGYLNHPNRTDKTDILLENTLKDDFGSMLVTEKMIANWICSVESRHFMNNCKNDEYFKENVMEEIMEF